MRALSALLLGLPVAVACRLLHAPEWAVFVCSAVALLPLAHWIGEATGNIADRTNAGLGGLLNATFGNAAELILTVLALRRGLILLVKASITGSILGNTLLVTGTSAVVGGLKHGRQQFAVKPAGRHASMMILAVAALLLPAVFAQVEPNAQARQDVSVGVAILLLLTYAASIYYAQFWRPRRDPSPSDQPPRARRKPHEPSLGRSIVILAAAVVGAMVASELLVGTVEGFSRAVGLTPAFIGLIVVPFIANVSEHWAAVHFALENKMDLSLSVAASSSTQIALLVAPLLVLVSLVFQPMDLTLTPLELLTLFSSTAIFAYLSVDGETNWFEGVQLLALYLIAAVAFFFLGGR